MLDQLTHATFAPLVGSRFTLRVSENSTIEVELTQAETLPLRAGRNGQMPSRAPFALIFRGPREFVLGQRIYSLEREGIFLVPIGPDAHGQQYEAVFN